MASESTLVFPRLVRIAMACWVENQADWETQLKNYRDIPRLGKIQELGGAYVYLLSEVCVHGWLKQQ